MPGRDPTEEVSAGLAAGEGMVMAHSLPPAPISLCVSLASLPPLSPRSTDRRACSLHSTGWYRNTQVCLWGFTATPVSALRDEPVPGMPQQCQPCTKATHMVSRLCKSTILVGEVQFYPRAAA